MPVNNPLSKVNKVELNKNDGTISLEVGLDGFYEGSPIEISGQATQANGAVASFYAIRTMPKPGQNPDGTPAETVVPVQSVAPVPPKKFDPDQPITVVSRAAEVWITTLEKDAGVTAEVNSAAWKVKNYSYAVCEAGHTPPGGGY